VKRLILLAATIGLLFEAECRWRVRDIQVGWEAYKTPLKIGVSGTFKNIRLSARPDETVDGLLEGASVSIDARSVYSKSAARDAKIAKYFFKAGNVTRIDAVITRLHDDLADVNITMNGISRIVPMRLERQDDTINPRGVLDLGDFNMLPALQQLTRACEKPHEGKTWQDVTLRFELAVKQRCR